MVEEMEIQKGFQKTDVGIIPNDWLLVTYDEAFDFLTTATYSRAQLSENDKIGYVHYGDIHTKCLHFLDFNKIKLPSIKPELLKNYPLLKDGDIITVDASEDYDGVGKSVEVRNLKTRKAISGLHTFLLRDKHESIANGFKGYIHSNKLVKKQMDTLATGMKVYGVSKTNLKLIKIPLPPTKAEQAAIAEALNDTDALITQLEKLIAKKKAIKQGSMQELLKPKEGWVAKTIEDLTDCLDNLRVPLNETQRLTMKGDYPYCGANGIVDFIDDFRIDDEVILIAEDGGYFDEYATRPIAYKMSGKFWVNNHAHILKAKPQFEQNFIYYSLVHKNILNFLASGTRAKLNKSQMYKIEIHCPNKKAEQTRIAQILSDMDAEIEMLEKKLDKYKMLKQGMMQNLLTGKIRLI
jgi:type I restriction enzyme S subunit